VKKINFLLIFFFLFAGLVVWLFPGTVDPVKFLGFSDPILIYEEELSKKKQKLFKERTPAYRKTEK